MLRATHRHYDVSSWGVSIDGKKAYAACVGFQKTEEVDQSSEERDPATEAASYRDTSDQAIRKALAKAKKGDVMGR